MFKKPNRNLRVRRAASSEEEEEDDGERGQPDRHRRPGGRGLTCGTRKKPDTDPPPQPDPQPQPDTATAARTPATVGLLSFTEEREGGDSFRIRKPAVNTVLFQVQRKTENVDKLSSAADHDFGGPGSHSEPEESNHEDLERANKEESLGPASSSSSPSLSPERPQSGEIPDGRQIRAARRQRKLARAKKDYISLDVSRELSESSHSESDNELDDHEKRIPFAPGVKSVKEQMAEEMSSTSSNSDSESQEDDALQDGWEEQQIRKAVKYPQIISESMLRGDSPPQVKKYTEPKISTPQITVEDVKNRLTARISSIQEVHRSHVLDNEKYQRDLEDSKNSLEKLERSASEQSYRFFKEMKVYVETFVDCLNEKILQINQLEAEMFQIFEERATTLLKRRQDDLRSESATIQKLSGNGVASDPATLANAEQNQIEDCELRRGKRRREREDARQNDHLEGMSSDDELPNDLKVHLQSSQENTLVQCKALFEDVDEDFCQIKNVLSKFHTWRTRFPESYYDAYISLCLHKLLNPLVRLQLVGWNPLQDTTELDKMAWYCDLEDFCFPKDEHENDTEENADHKVLAAVIEKIVVPKVSAFVERVWDPLSSKQTDRLVCLCKTHVLENESSKMVKGLIVCLVSRLTKAIEDDVYIPLYPQRLLEDRNSLHAKFRERQFWSAVKLLGHVVRWDGFLEEEVLQELALDRLLNRYLLLVLLNAEPDGNMVTKCSKIVECLPQSWFKGLESGTTISRLANFSKHLQQCVHVLHKHNDSSHATWLTTGTDLPNKEQQLEHLVDSAFLTVGSAPKFPVMDTNCNVDLYLQSFEKICRQHHLPRSQWALYLTPGLKDKALEEFIELPPEKDGDYEAIRDSIVAKYQLTPEVYRRRNNMKVMVSLLLKIKAQNYANEVIEKYSLGQMDGS
ncbi:intron Large complex component GCFC2 [Gastrophryne carolinensis]